MEDFLPPNHQWPHTRLKTAAPLKSEILIEIIVKLLEINTAKDGTLYNIKNENKIFYHVTHHVTLGSSEKGDACLINMGK
jgi:hypothetical protein